MDDATTCPTCGGSGIVQGGQPRLSDDGSLSDRDQAASDQDQTLSDHDQAASDQDSERAAEDQAASDQDLEAGGDPAVHEQTRLAREHAAATRDEVSALRDTAGTARLATAAARDQAAEQRDGAAAEREARGAADIAEIRARAARDRARAASDRARAAADRAAAAREREAARLARAEADHRARLAATDELTGAWTRRFGLAQLERELERVRRTGEALTIAFVDVDRLKEVNDESGHPAGDRLLRQTVDVMRANVRPYDIVVRFGGDEFLCAMPGLGPDDARERLAAIAAALAVSQPGHSISFGVSEHEPGVELDDLIARADTDLLDARRTSGEGAGA